MKKVFLVLSAAVIILSCSRMEKPTALKDTPPENPVILPFGPFFLPENHSLSSVSLNYVTGTPQKTTVYFTMVGELDWARNDQTLTCFHKMVFRDLEESAVYQFTIPSNEKEINHSSAIQTMPFGEDYEFQFAIASMDKEIDNNIQPHFLVLGSEKEQISENEFYSFFGKNRKLLGSTILVPMFGLKLEKPGVANFDLTAVNDGFQFIRYKDLSLMLVTKQMPNYDFLTGYLSNNPEDQNVIVLTHVAQEDVIVLARRFALLNCRIYTFNRDIKPDQLPDNVTPVDQFQLVHIIKKHAYALVLTNLAR